MDPFLKNFFVSLQNISSSQVLKKFILRLLVLEKWLQHNTTFGTYSVKKRNGEEQIIDIANFLSVQVNSLRHFVYRFLENHFQISDFKKKDWLLKKLQLFIVHILCYSKMFQKDNNMSYFSKNIKGRVSLNSDLLKNLNFYDLFENTKQEPSYSTQNNIQNLYPRNLLNHLPSSACANICYANAVLQAVIHTPGMRSTFLNFPKIKNEETFKYCFYVIYFLRKILCNAYTSIDEYVNDKLDVLEFTYYNLELYTNSFITEGQNDSIDYLQIFMHRLQEEVMTLYLISKETEFYHYFKQIKQICVDNFRHTNITVISCKETEKKLTPTYHDEDLMYTLRLFNYSLSTNNILQALLLEYQVEEITEFNACNGKEAKRYHYFYKLPKTLVLALKRNIGENKKSDKKIAIENNLTLQEVSPNGKDLQNVHYKLYSIVIHSGSTKSGHWINYSKKLGSKDTWFLLNDLQKVQHFSFEAVQKSSQAASLLFYKREEDEREDEEDEEEIIMESDEDEEDEEEIIMESDEEEEDEEEIIMESEEEEEEDRDKEKSRSVITID